jgi:hypothetical protein
MAHMRAHRRSEGKMPSRGSRITGPREGQAKTKAGVVIGRAVFHDHPEIVRCCGVSAGIELCTR